MGKTVFTEGNPQQGIPATKVTDDFLNAVQNHRHDGLDQDGSAPLDYAADTGAVNAYAFALNPALTAYVDGLPMWFKAANTSTGPSTVDVNGLGPKTIKRGGSDTAGGDITAGQIYCLIFDGVNVQLKGSDNASNAVNAVTAANATTHILNTSNPHNVTKAQVGLGNCDNTADANKSVSYATSAGNADTVDGYNASDLLANADLGILTTKSSDTVYQAVTDGFVYGYGTVSSYVAKTGLVGNTSNPSIVVQEQGGVTVDGHRAAICFPVRKNDYWKVTGCSAVYWSALGT